MPRHNPPCATAHLFQPFSVTISKRIAAGPDLIARTLTLRALGLAACQSSGQASRLVPRTRHPPLANLALPERCLCTSSTHSAAMLVAAVRLRRLHLRLCSLPYVRSFVCCHLTFVSTSLFQNQQRCCACASLAYQQVQQYWHWQAFCDRHLNANNIKGNRLAKAIFFNIIQAATTLAI